MMILRFLRELVGAAAFGTASALLWLSLGTLWTWAVDHELGIAWLGNSASAAIAVPAFVLGWIAFLMRTTVLQSRACWMLASIALTLGGALMHRAIFFSDDAWAASTFVDAIEASLAVLGRVFAHADTPFMTAPPLESWSMVIGALVGATALSAVTYGRLRALVVVRSA